MASSSSIPEMRATCESLVNEIIAEAVKRVEARRVVEIAASSSDALVAEVKAAAVKAVVGPEINIFGYEMTVKVLQLATMALVALFSFIMALILGRIGA